MPVKISVFTPTLNRPDMLARAASSVFMQSYTDWEWIVLNVGSIPVKSLLPSDRRIRYVDGGQAEGPALDFERALSLTTGEVVHPLSDDDMLTHHALEIAATEIAGHEWLVGKTLLHDDEGEPTLERGGTRESFDRTMAGEYMLGGAVYWRRGLSDLLGGFNPDFSGAADVDLYMRFGRHCEPRIIPDVLYLYFDHPGTDSRQNPQHQQRQVKRILGG